MFVGGVRHGLRHPVVRPLMLAAAVANTFMMFGFYSWQRYFLDLLGKELVWVNGVVAALVGAASIAGNLAMSRVAAMIGTRTGVLIACVAVRTVTIMLCGLAPSFGLAVGLYLISNFAGGIASPIRQGLIDHHIPSSQRATILSVDSLFSELGSGIGQSGWGYLARRQSIGTAWVAAGAFLVLGIPLLALARRADPENDRVRRAGARRRRGELVSPAGNTALPAGTLTFVFTDIEGSTRLVQQLGEARFNAVLEDQRPAGRRGVRRRGRAPRAHGGGQLLLRVPARQRGRRRGRGGAAGAGRARLPRAGGDPRAHGPAHR